MATDSPLSQLLKGTRRRIVLLLRQGERTVRELAEALDLTRNAIRSQLSNLQGDGLAEIVGRRPTDRKPENVYGLTEKAEKLFPKAYDEVLNTLVSVLSEKNEDLSSVFEEVGRRLARPDKPHELAESTRERLERAKAVLEEMGGLPIIEEHEDGYRLVGASCPLASVVEAHGPLACDLAAALVEELTERPVDRQCEVEGECPRCVFVVDK